MNIVLKEVKKTGVKVKLSYGERKRERGRGRGRGGRGEGSTELDQRQHIVKLFIGIKRRDRSKRNWKDSFISLMKRGLLLLSCCLIYIF